MSASAKSRKILILVWRSGGLVWGRPASAAGQQVKREKDKRSIGGHSLPFQATAPC